jgi:hypothetical protein
MVWLVLGAAPAAATHYLGADWAGADLIVADGDVLEGTFTNVGRFEVPALTRVAVEPEVPLVVEADEIVIAGALFAKGAGFPAQHAEADGNGPGGGEWSGSMISGGGGGGHGGKGGRGGPGECFAGKRAGGAGGPTVGDPTDMSAPLGSGGAPGKTIGATDFFGAAGGGSVTLRADTIWIAPGGIVGADGDRAPSADNNDFDSGVGGGGAGGTVLLDATTDLLVEGTLSVRGGAGGDGMNGYCAEGGGGGGGGGGVLKMFGPFSGMPPLPSLRTSGGEGGITGGGMNSEGKDGQPGTIYVDALVAGPPVLSAAAGVDLTITGGSGYGRLIVLTGVAIGTDALPGGHCAGTVTGLDQPEITAQADLGGNGAWTKAGLNIAPGTPIQALDLWSCTLSDVVLAP